MVKRAFDILASALGLIIFLPILLVVALWIKLDSPGPVLYLGRRVGRGGKRFNIMKFRTMVINAESIGGSSTADDDPRITRVGKFLRRYKLDELPQLFNVFAGSMSFVGPRPQVEWAVEQYSAEERRLLEVRPGITDYASLAFRNEGEILRGSENPDRDYMEKIAPGKMRLGLLYVNTHDIRTDCRIIAATVLSIFGVDPAWCFTSSARDALKPLQYAKAA